MSLKCIFMMVMLIEVNGKLTSVTSSNVEEILGPKSEYHKFVKFFAPWCGHCKKMRPDWDKLADEFPKAHDNVVIADVDCTVEKDLCSKYNVEGFPTLKYFMPNSEDGDDYSGNDRSLKGLTDWAEDKLKLFKCSIDNLEFCTKEQASFVKKLSTMSDSDKSSLLKDNDDNLTKMQKDHDDLLKSLQSQFSSSSEKLQSVKSRVAMENGMVRKSMSKSSKDEL